MHVKWLVGLLQFIFEINLDYMITFFIQIFAFQILLYKLGLYTTNAFQHPENVPFNSFNIILSLESFLTRSCSCVFCVVE